MKILCVAKSDYSGLTEGMVRAFAHLGQTVEFFNLRPYRRIEKYFGPKWTCLRLRRCLERFSPDIVFVVAPLFIRQELYEPLSDYRTRQPSLLAGWIGDKISEAGSDRLKLGVFDQLYVTDSGFSAALDGHSHHYLPLATDPELFASKDARTKYACTFVASRTSNRASFLHGIDRSVDVFGPGWKDFRGGEGPRCHSGKISLRQTAELYSQSAFVLNIKNADNVVNGLNQRSFDPGASRRALLHDAVADLPLNFEPGVELLVFTGQDDFREQYDRLQADRSLCARIAENGYKRVMSSHTYKHRAATILHDLAAFRRPV